MRCCRSWRVGCGAAEATDWALFVVLLYTPVCCQPTELILDCFWAYITLPPQNRWSVPCFQPISCRCWERWGGGGKTKEISMMNIGLITNRIIWNSKKQQKKCNNTPATMWVDLKDMGRGAYSRFSSRFESQFSYLLLMTPPSEPEYDHRKYIALNFCFTVKRRIAMIWETFVNMIKG